MPPMPVPSRKSVASLFAASWFAVAGVVFVGAGCEREDERADRAVEDAVRAAAGDRGETSVAALEKAAKEAGASAGATSHAKALIAQAQVEQAQQILREVDAQEAVV